MLLAALHELENIQANVNKKTTEKSKNDQHLTKNARKRRRREYNKIVSYYYVIPDGNI